MWDFFPEQFQYKWYLSGAFEGRAHPLVSLRDWRDGCKVGQRATTAETYADRH